MNQHLQTILDFIQKSETLSSEEKNAFLNSLKAVDKELEITAFKLDRTEKVKRTTAILLEETIEELEQKRKAVEAQNRELEISAALERVRAAATAMNKPDDMVHVCHVISDQLQLLGVTDIRNVQTVIINDKKATYLNYQYFTSYKEGIVEETDYNKHPKVLAMVEEMKKAANSSFHGSMEDSELDIFRNWRKQQNQFPDPLLDESRSMHYYFLSIGQGGLGLTTYKPLPEEGLKIFKKFHNVFTLAYRRFTDIEFALAQAREAEIQLALERVRARTMAMYKSDELSDVVWLLHKQFKELDFGLYQILISIFNTDKQHIEWWSRGFGDNTPPQRYIIPFTNHPFPLMQHQKWKNGETYYAHILEGELKRSWEKYLFSKTDLKFFPEEVKQQMQSLQRVYLSDAFMKYGVLQAAGPEPLTQDKAEILVRFAKVLDQAYTRMMDLQKAEAQARQAEQDLIEIKAARQEAEEALAELKATQVQLIHAEKMASLGELTAGIAHEIQNPLNFVNNFSEVSIELVNELREQLDLVKTQYIASQQASQQVELSHWGATQDILDDLETNQQKINHHGNRADAIVKGMLQHSRSSSGQKEPTDINALCAEYLRLVYHGLRARDKSFNADFRLEADELLPKVNVIPQDIGRVLLNLINNAFYAVSKRNLSGSENLTGSTYNPAVTVSTKNLGNHVEIRVTDNGGGIPDEIKDKIFQPFFTTKPTGEGTGLGLSLSYDIITKGHNGKLIYSSIENVGTEFVVQLPVISIRP